MQLKINPKLKTALKIGGTVAVIIFLGGLAYYLALDKPLNTKERKNVSEYLKKVCSTDEFQKTFPSLAIYAPKAGDYPNWIRSLPPAIFSLSDTWHRQYWDTSTISVKFIDSLTNYLNRNLRKTYHRIRMEKPARAVHFIWKKKHYFGEAEKEELTGVLGFRFYKAKKEGCLKTIISKQQ